MSISKRLRRAAVGVAALAVLGSAASVASASLINVNDPDNPNTTNVPYLAWRGENLRMVKCFGVNDFNDAWNNEVKVTTDSRRSPFTNDSLSQIFSATVDTNVTMEDWSGDYLSTNIPHEVQTGARTFLWYNLRTGDPVVCFQDTWASQKAGLGQFKLTVGIKLAAFGVNLGSEVLVVQHQWLAGWMNLNAPTLDEVSSRTPATNPEGLGDPKGDGAFFAGDNWVQGSDGKWYFDTKAHPGEIRATVKGTLPLGQDFSELGLGASVTLPDDWAALAGVLATDADAKNSNQPMRWDIHDEITDEHGNVNAGPTPTTNAGGRDGVGTTANNVANVWPNNGGNTWGDASFSRDGVTTSEDLLPTLPASDYPTTGPFDPNFAEETLLPDGQLNSGDAPMPAARIDFAIKANSNPLTSTDGVGSLGSDYKSNDYSIDNKGTNTAGNLFAPFYSQYIPATSRADDIGYASGVDGALITNNFPGFLTFGKTVNWTAFPLVTPTSTLTNCDRTVPLGDESGSPRSTPGGDQTVAVYSDEHGEARASYLPGGRYGNDFFFDALVPQAQSNNGCDLIGQKILGTSTITAIARYPYQKVTDPDKPAKTVLTKTVYNLFDKHLSYYPKTFAAQLPDATLEKVIVAHAQDINGQPFVNEVVCFSGAFTASGAAINGFFPQATGPFKVLTGPGATDFYYVNFSGEVKSPLGSGYRCTLTDSNGNAVFEIQGSETLTADVIATFPSEGLSRHIDVLAGSPTSESNIPALTPEIILAGGSATTGPGSNGTGAPTQTEIQTVVKAAIAGGFGIVATPATTVTPTQTITPLQTITVHKTAIKVRLLTMRLVRPAHGKAYFLVKVQSPNKTAKITIALKGKNGKTIIKLTKTVKANTLLKIQSSHLTLAVRKLSLILVK